LGDDIIIGYNALGAPVLSRLAATGSPEITPVPDDQICRITDDYPDHPGYIGVSHTRGWVAVVWSPEPCAVDIELKGRAISPAVRSRYSIETISDWCALEARYKYESLIGGASASESETVPGAEIDVPPSCSESAPVEVRFVSHPELVVAVVGAKMKP
jgi:hypothetical protein